MLSKIFSGESGLAAALLELLGDRATLKIFIEPGCYEYRAVAFAQESLSTSEAASRVPGGRSWDTTVMSNGLRRLGSTAVFLIAAAKLESEPKIALDIMSVDGKDYRVVDVENVRAGAVTALYRLTCERL